MAEQPSDGNRNYNYISKNFYPENNLHQKLRFQSKDAFTELPKSMLYLNDSTSTVISKLL